jgi:hypothetical protein
LLAQPVRSLSSVVSAVIVSPQPSSPVCASARPEATAAVDVEVLLARVPDLPVSEEVRRHIGTMLQGIVDSVEG